jgi:hypothetical protein
MKPNALIPIEHIEDWEKRIARQDAFWSREIIDRPVVVASVRSPNQNYPAPASKVWKSDRERWMDSQYIAELALHYAMNTEFLGDNLPQAWPNLGPEVFSAFFGCELEYGAETSWSIPCIKDWADADKTAFSQDNFYWKKIEEMTDALLEIGKGKFYTGITDIHTGGDAIVAFRDPIEMNIDMIENVDHVKAMLERVNQTYFQIFDHYYNKLISAGQVITTWAGIASSKKWYVPSNDFSCMISKKMFDDVFLPGIAKECKFLETSIYHLDGPGALRHLDSLLEIRELNAIQWVYGDSRGPASDWMHVYKKIQDAGKGAQFWIHADELDFFIENLRPEGLWVGLWGIQTREDWQALMKKIEGWR